MTRLRISLALALGAGIACSPALALPPDQVFERAGPAIWSVRALDADEKTLATGSAVVVGPARLVTSCQVLARARKLEVRRGNSIYEARLEFPDVERDLCQLSAEGLNAPAVTRSSARRLRPGQRVYVIGFTRPTEQSIVDGLVSALRDEGTANERVQTSVPAARGLLGGGLFDEEARLVGIVTASAKDAQNLTLALPSDWLAELAGRGAAALAKRTEVARAEAAASAPRNAPAHPGLPVLGSTWKYSFADQRYSSGFQLYTVRVTAVDGWNVQESFDPGDGTQSSVAVDAKHLEFSARRLGREQLVMEIGPYFYPTDLARSAAAHVPKAYPLSSGVWSMDSARISEEVAIVPAGSFKALRLDISGSNFQAAVGYPTRFEYTAWYAPDVKRYVMLRHRSWLRQGTPYADEVVKLVEYKSN